MNSPLDVLKNPIFLSAVIAWALAQAIKVPVEYFRSGKINLALMLSSGGMPSSHSAMMVSTTYSAGLFVGFDSAVFAVVFPMTMIVIYDATGVRRQTGLHAEKINLLIREFVSGDFKAEKKLREVLGHTPLEAIFGVLLGLVTAHILWGLWK
ncbi:MAG TPA: divergent PAP2 family protein [Anaerolineales bacterium]|nr:divergent PAP2 family protein [Anaerolineales bacterium]